ARSVAQRGIVSWKNRWRLHNLLADATAPQGTVLCRVIVPGAVDVRLELDLSDYLSRAWYFLGYCGYEWGTTQLLERLLPRCSVALDVGSNIGYYTMLMGRLMRNGEVHAFEPWQPMYARLQRNVELNEFDQLFIHCMAVSDQDGEQTLYTPPDPNRHWT